jgi:hypothetical protein
MTVNDKRIISVIFSLYLTSTVVGQNTPTVRWGHQLVTPTKDTIFGAMVVDSNDGIYIAVSRTPMDAPDSTSKDQYLLKYNQDGEQVWSKQLGENAGEDPLHLVVQGLAADDQENIYVFGYTDSKLGQEKKGGYDAFIAKYDQAGTQQWVWQLGTPEHDVCTGLDIDASGNLYITGYTYGSFAKPNKGQADIFVAAYNQTGTLLWQDQAGTDVDDRAMGIRLGNNNDLYLCGSTNGTLARENNSQPDIVVARYERTGKPLWLHQYGTEAADVAICIEISEHGQVYAGGITYGNFASQRAQRGRGDAFVARIAETGELLWKRQFGSNRWTRPGTWSAFRTVTYWQTAVRFHQGSVKDSVVVTHRKAS